MNKEEVKALGIYTEIFFNEPVQVINILNQLKRIEGHHYGIDIYSDGDFMDFPVHLDDNKELLSKIFLDIDKYIERLDKRYAYSKEVDGKVCVGLVQLSDDLNYVHRCVRLRIDTADNFYDANYEDNTDYYNELIQN